MSPPRRKRGRPRKYPIRPPVWPNLPPEPDPPESDVGVSDLPPESDQSGPRVGVSDLLTTDGLSPIALRIVEFRMWLASGRCMIRDRTGSLLTLYPNRFQTALLDIVTRIAQAGRPIRVIVLKARQLGCSTIIQALLYFLARQTPHWLGYTLAHTDDSTRSIFSITRRIRRYDRDLPEMSKPGNRHEIVFPHDSLFKTRTAGGHYVGTASTINALHLSEVPKWQGAPAAVRDQLLSALNAVPDDPNSVVFIEATANMNDESREFETRFRAAEANLSSYVALFGAWFHEDSYRAPAEKMGALTEYEQGLVERFRIGADQLAWLRRVTLDKCGGNETHRRQEYPSTPDEAFQSATGRIFPGLCRERHALQIADVPLHAPGPPDGDKAVSKGWTRYRGVDWGGSHPFACLWIAHRDGPPRFTIDVTGCPQTWKQLMGWSRDGRGQPSDVDDDAADALRYVVMTFGLIGHVHVYRELVIADSAKLGWSELDLAERVKALSGSERYVGTVADRTRPNSIVLFSQRGVPCTAAPKPSTTQRGEIEDGIATLTALMAGTVPFRTPPPEPSLTEQLLRLKRTIRVPYVETDFATLLEMRLARTVRSGEHPFLGGCY